MKKNGKLKLKKLSVAKLNHANTILGGKVVKSVISVISQSPVCKTNHTCHTTHDPLGSSATCLMASGTC